MSIVTPKPIPGAEEKLFEQIRRVQSGDVVTERERQLFLTIRQAHIMMLGAIEDYLGMERSIVPKHTKR